MINISAHTQNEITELRHFTIKDSFLSTKTHLTCVSFSSRANGASSLTEPLCSPSRHLPALLPF